MKSSIDNKINLIVPVAETLSRKKNFLVIFFPLMVLAGANDNTFLLKRQDIKSVEFKFWNPRRL